MVDRWLVFDIEFVGENKTKQNKQKITSDNKSLIFCLLEHQQPLCASVLFANLQTCDLKALWIVSVTENWLKKQKQNKTFNLTNTPNIHAYGFRGETKSCFHYCFSIFFNWIS